MARLLFFPAPTTNPYLTMLIRDLTATGYKVDIWSPGERTRDVAVLHLHWIESIAMGRLARRSIWISDFLFRRLMASIKQIKRRGGLIVWTAHNAAPHEQHQDARASLISDWIALIVEQADVIICLSSAAIPEVKAAYPAASARFVVIPHQHYREWYTLGNGADFRTRHGIPSDARLISMIGLLRGYKRIAAGIRLFAQAKKPGDHLLIAGDCFDPEIKAEIEKEAISAGDVTVVIGNLDDQQFSDAHDATDLTLCMQEKLLNSGSVIASLSLNIPVLALPVGSLRELQAIVGDDWLSLREPITPEELNITLQRAKATRVRLAKPDLRDLDPAKVVYKHLEVYRLASAFRSAGDEPSPYVQ